MALVRLFLPDDDAAVFRWLEQGWSSGPVRRASPRPGRVVELRRCDDRVFPARGGGS